MNDFWSTAVKSAGALPTEHEFNDMMRHLLEYNPPRCAHIVPVSWLRRWRAEGRETVACPMCGETCRV